MTALAATACTTGASWKLLTWTRVRSNGYSFQVEMTFRAQLAGFRITEVPIIFMERRAGQSKLSKGVVWESFVMPLNLRWRERALRREIGKTQPSKEESR